MSWVRESHSRQRRLIYINCCQLFGWTQYVSWGTVSRLQRFQSILYFLVYFNLSFYPLKDVIKPNAIPPSRLPKRPPKDPHPSHPSVSETITSQDPDDNPTSDQTLVNIIWALLLLIIVFQTNSFFVQKIIQFNAFLENEFFQ